jgi:hypothetical protein
MDVSWFSGRPLSPGPAAGQAGRRFPSPPPGPGRGGGSFSWTWASRARHSTRSWNCPTRKGFRTLSFTVRPSSESPVQLCTARSSSLLPEPSHADPEEVLRHPRWHDLAGGFSETDATLLLFLPTEIPGADSILKLGTDVVFLAAQGESADALLGAASVKLVVTLGPLASPQEVAGDPSYPGEPPAWKASPASGYPRGQETWEQKEAGALSGDEALAEDEEALSSRFRLPEGFLPENTDDE